MITVVQDFNAVEHASLLFAMFRLRARVFQSRLNWDVTVRDGLERDSLDNESPVYLIHTNHHGMVDGSCRLLPTTGPTLISTCFADTMPDAALLSAPSIWECTRFCIDYEGLGSAASEQATRICGELLTQIGVLSLGAGIETIIGNFDDFMLRLYRRIGCEVEVLGSTRRFGRPVYLGAFRISGPVVARGLERFPSRQEGIMS